MTTRTDIPPALLAQAAALGPSVLTALIACYPTDRQHEEMVRTRNRRRRQLEMRFKETA
jgi:hypothetical protein